MPQATLADVVITFQNAFNLSLKEFEKAMANVVKAMAPWAPTINEAKRSEMRKIHTQYRQRRMSRGKKRR